MKNLAKQVIVLAALLAITFVSGCATSGQKIARGYFGLGDHQHVVHITSSSDFYMNIWARNVETSQGGVQISTSPSQFRGSDATGPKDVLVLDVPAQTGMDVGTIGARGGETIDITNAFGARVTILLTVHSAADATVNMTWE